MTAVVMLLLAASTVDVSNDGCPLNSDKVRRLAEIELQRGPSDVRVLARLECKGTRFQVIVEDPLTNKTLLRALQVKDLTTNAPERFAALALVELVEASWSELLLPPTASSAPVVAAPEAKRAAVESLGRPRVRLGAHGSARVFTGSGLVMGGGGVHARVTLIGPFGIAIDLGAEHGETKTSAGLVVADSLSAAGFVVAHLQLGRVLLGGGPGFRGGGARLVGTPVDSTVVEGRTLSAALAGPALLGEAALGLGRFDLSFTVESGWALWNLQGRVDGQPLTALANLWLSATLGVGVQW